MAYKDKPEESEVWKPSVKDAQLLSEKLKLFSAKVISGKKIYPFEQYLESEGIIRIDDTGHMFVKSPQRYYRGTEVKGLMDWIAQKDQETLFHAFPEERIAYQARIEKIGKEARKLFTHFKIPDESTLLLVV